MAPKETSVKHLLSYFKTEALITTEPSVRVLIYFKQTQTSADSIASEWNMIFSITNPRKKKKAWPVSFPATGCYNWNIRLSRFKVGFISVAKGCENCSIPFVQGQNRTQKKNPQSTSLKHRWRKQAGESDQWFNSSPIWMPVCSTTKVIFLLETMLSLVYVLWQQ